MSINIKAVIFDLDGTLADTQLDLADSMNYVLSKHNYPTHSHDEYKYLVGKGLKNLVIQSLPRNILSGSEISKIHNELIKRYSKNCLNKTRLYSGIQELLEEIQRLNIPFSVFSNKDHELTIKVAKSLLKNYHVHTILGRTDEIPRKPEPDGALYVAENMGVNPSNILYIGDTNNDMICAKKSGMHATGVLWGFRKKKELVESGADYIVSKPMQIIDILLGTDKIAQ